MRRAYAPAFVLLFLLLGSCCPPTILTDSLPPGRVGEPYWVALEAECWGGHWWVSGELPPGLSFNSNGVFSGTPRFSGLYFLNVTWEDVFEGEVISSVTRAFDLLILEEGEILTGEAELKLRGGSGDFVF
jgi:hypothetical protein